VAWEDEGGRRREFLSACEQIQILLRIKPWEDGPWMAEAEEPPAWATSAADRDCYARAHELYLLLERAAATEPTAAERQEDYARVD
jgi:hypothetical protein